MQNLTKRCIAIFVLATAAVAVAPITAMADRAIVKHSGHGHGAKVRVVKQQPPRHAVGHRFRKQDVVVINNWRARGLSHPGRNEVYLEHGGRIYLAVAATLLIKSLID